VQLVRQMTKLDGMARKGRLDRCGDGFVLWTIRALGFSNAHN